MNTKDDLKEKQNYRKLSGGMHYIGIVYHADALFRQHRHDRHGKMDLRYA